MIVLLAIASIYPSRRWRFRAAECGHDREGVDIIAGDQSGAGVSLGEATKLIEQMEQRIGMPSPIRGTFAGTAKAFQGSLATEPLLIVTALPAIYIVLGIL